MAVYLVSVLVCLLPGGLLGFAVPPGRERWLAWAAAPILTLGLTTAATAWLPALGLPSSAQWVLAVEIAAAVLAAAASWLVARARTAPATAGTPAADRTLAAVPRDTAGERPPAPEAAPPAAGSEPPAARPARAPSWREWLYQGSPRPSLADLAGLALPAAAAVALGRLLLGGLVYPPGWDAMNHALLTRNILHAGSTAAKAVCVTGLPLPKPACTFSPFGMDVSWAQAAALSGGHISAAMLAWMVLIGPVALVAAVYAAVRAFGGTPLVAACAAIAPVVVSPLWPSLLSGRPPETFAPGMSVVVGLLAGLAIRGKYPVRLGLLAGLGLAGLVLAHTYDVLFAGTLALAFLSAERSPVRLRPALTAGAAIGGAALASCAPLAKALLGLRGVTASATQSHVMPLGKAWHYWVTDPRNYILLGPAPAHPSATLHLLPVRAALWLTLLCLLASPLCFAVRQLRWARPWFLAWLLWTGVGLWTSASSSSLPVFLASLWYGSPSRLRNMTLPLHGVLAVAGACAIGLGLARVVTEAARRGRSLRGEQVAAGVAAGLLALSVIGFAAVPAASRTLIKDYHRREPVGAAYPRVFTWLAQHTPAGTAVVYNRHEDFMTWSYADYGVPGLFGDPPRVQASKQDYRNRWRIWFWLTGRPGIPPTGCLVRRYRVQYLVVGRQHLPEPKGFAEAHLVSYSLARLAANPAVRLVHRDGGIQVYAVTRAGLACPG